MKNFILLILIILNVKAELKEDINTTQAPAYWLKNLHTYYRIPKNWFFEKRFENNALSLYITKDQFDKNEQFKIGFSLHYISNCKGNVLQNPNKLIPSLNAKNLITNLSYNMNNKILSKPYSFKDNHLIGYGVTVKNQSITMRSISLGDDINNICLRLIFEAPNKEWKSVEKIGNAIIESHWR